MKKVLSLVLACIMLVGTLGVLASCGGDVQVKIIDIKLKFQFFFVN